MHPFFDPDVNASRASIVNRKASRFYPSVLNETFLGGNESGYAYIEEDVSQFGSIAITMTGLITSGSPSGWSGTVALQGAIDPTELGRTSAQYETIHYTVFGETSSEMPEDLSVVKIGVDGLVKPFKYLRLYWTFTTGAEGSIDMDVDVALKE